MRWLHLLEGAAARFVKTPRGSSFVAQYPRRLHSRHPRGGQEAPVIRNNVYHPDFQGSFSLKYVLNLLVPELTYDDLVIVDGQVASVEIARLLFVAHKIPPAERDSLRLDLLDYCERDTWAMVKLLERLRELAA